MADYKYSVPTYAEAMQRSATGATVYLYEFDYCSHDTALPTIPKEFRSEFG